MPKRKLSEWRKAYEIDKDARAERKERAFNLWLAFHTQEQIAEDVGVPQRTISDWVDGFSEISNLTKSAKVAAEFLDFEQPLYNVWRWGGPGRKAKTVASCRPRLTECRMNTP